jgi:hypothetical protein
MICSILNNLVVELCGEMYVGGDGELLLDSTFEPEEYATLEGVVVGVPYDVLSDGFRGDLRCDLLVGDKVCFNYNVVFNYVVRREGETPVYVNLLEYDGRRLWRVDMIDVFCYERGGVRYSLGGKVMLEVTSGCNVKSDGGLDLIGDDGGGYGVVGVLPFGCLDYNVGDVIYFEKDYGIRYKLFGKDYVVVDLKRVIGKEVN